MIRLAVVNTTQYKTSPNAFSLLHVNTKQNLNFIVSPKTAQLMRY